MPRTERRSSPIPDPISADSAGHDAPGWDGVDDCTLASPNDWNLFATNGFDPRSLMAWATAPHRWSAPLKNQRLLRKSGLTVAAHRTSIGTPRSWR